MAFQSPRDVEAEAHQPTPNESRRVSLARSSTTQLPDLDQTSASLDDLGPPVCKQREPTSRPGPKTNGDAPETPSPTKRPWWHFITKPVVQMVIALCLAVMIGLVVASTVHEVPVPARAVLAIPGDLWLRALKCMVVPLISTSLILSVQRLKQMPGRGARVATWTLGYYFTFMMIAIGQSTVATALGWSRLFVMVQPGQLQSNLPPAANTTQLAPHEVVVQVFESLIPENVVGALAADQRLLSVLVMALVVGYLLRPTSVFVKAVEEVEELVADAVAFLIRASPVGVFFLILPSLFVLPIRDVGRNLGVLIGASLAGMFVHLFVVVSLFYLAVVRENPYAFWLRIAPAWIEAWGSGSSAATLPVTMECVLEQKVPLLVTRFVVPLGVLINMDGTALYFPVAVTFMAATQGISLSTGDYVIVGLLSTLSTIGASPIPGSALVFVVMICGAVNIPVTGMYAVVVAIDWFIDRFRTALNASGDAFAAKVVAKVTGVHDGMDDKADEYGERLYEMMVEHDPHGDRGRPVRRIGTFLTV